jgi:hypothetical protein
MEIARDSRLAALEEVIERGLGTFVEVGEALTEIRDSRLYQDTHGTFERYCRERWGISRPRAYELIGAATVVRELSGMPDRPLPQNARQATEIARIPEPARRAEVWHDTIERHGPTPTAAHVREVRDEAGLGTTTVGDLDHIPEMRQISEEERVYDNLVRMSLCVKRDPAAVAAAAIAYRYGSSQARGWSAAHGARPGGGGLHRPQGATEEESEKC